MTLPYATNHYAKRALIKDTKRHQPLKVKKEEILLSPMTKAPTPTEMSKGKNDITNNATKKFDYRAVADRLRTVSWRTMATQLVWLTWFISPTFRLPATAV